MTLIINLSLLIDHIPNNNNNTRLCVLLKCIWSNSNYFKQHLVDFFLKSIPNEVIEGKCAHLPKALRLLVNYIIHPLNLSNDQPPPPK